MDAVEFLKERRRMCVNNDWCKKCLLGVSENGVNCRKNYWLAEVE